MGRPYANELSELEATYEFVSAIDISKFAHVLSMLKFTSVVTIGSGGSYSAASYVSLLHTLATGRLAKPMTPLEALVNMPVTNVSAIFLSASGRNKDILRSLKYIQSKEPEVILAATVRRSTPLGKSAILSPGGYSVALGNGVRKDGYLATNSLLGFGLFFLRGYAAMSRIGDAVPANLGELESSIEVASSERTASSEPFSPLLDRQTISIVHCPYSLPGALDMESRLVESALRNVQLADIRNFSHGRHYWLERHGNETAVLFLTSENYRKLSLKTKKLIPPSIPTGIVHLGTDNWAVGLRSILFSIRFAGTIGDWEGIDPGRPSVPQYGRKLFQIGLPEAKPDEPHRMAVMRKTWALYGFNPSAQQVLAVENSLRTFLCSLSAVKFRALVVDFDGTLTDTEDRFNPLSSTVTSAVEQLLSHGVKVAVVSGRGNSLVQELRSAIPRKFWKSVLVGLYNGSCLGWLTEKFDSKSEDESTYRWAPVIELVTRIPEVHLREYPNQLSIEPKGDLELMLLWRQVSGLLASKRFKDLRALVSGHSVDILTERADKRRVFDYLHEKDSKISIDNALVIGDKGRWPGNDSEFLASPSGLSVDEVSEHLEHCWRLTPSGIKGRRAFEYYIDQIRLLERRTFQYVTTNGAGRVIQNNKARRSRRTHTQH